jgi:hypothetical protein
VSTKVRAILEEIRALQPTEQRDAGADVSALGREIDGLVYALFGLTPDEIKIVEGSAK